MNVAQLKRFCRGLPHAAETLYGEPWNFLVYSVGGRKFAYFKTSHPERWRFSTRVTPDRFVELTDVPGVKPARYRGRFHWITIVDVSSFPAAYLREMVESSYWRAFASLTKARQRALVSRSVSSDDKGASGIGRQARREADSVARATVRPSNAAWRPIPPRTIKRIYGTGH